MRAGYRVAVTGSCGFIGSALVRRLISKDDYQVLSLDALAEASDFGRIASSCRSSRFQHQTIDVRNPGAVNGVMQRFDPDAIVHLAAETSVDRSFGNPRLFYETNTKGTKNVVQSAGRLSVSRLIHVSTDEVFGPRTRDDAADVSAPFRPTNPYAQSKADAETVVNAFRADTSCQMTIIRPCNVYGPWQWPEKLIPKLIACCQKGEAFPVYGDGTNVRSWLFVDDLCEAIEKLLWAKTLRAAYNLPSPYYRSVNDVVNSVEQFLGQSVIRTYGYDREVHDTCYAMLGGGLDWEANTDFKNGVYETATWYMEHMDWTLRSYASASRFGANGL